MVHWMLFTNALIETYPSLRGLLCVLVWGRGEWEGDNLHVGLVELHKGVGGKSLEEQLCITNRLVWEVVKSLSKQLLMTEMGKARYKLIWVPVNLNNCMILWEENEGVGLMSFRITVSVKCHVIRSVQHQMIHLVLVMFHPCCHEWLSSLIPVWKTKLYF